MRNRKSGNDYRVQELRKVIGAFNLMPSLSSNAYDNLIFKILKRIDEGIDFDGLVRFIRSELVGNYGLYADEVPAEEIANSIDDWFLNYQESHK